MLHSSDFEGLVLSLRNFDYETNNAKGQNQVCLAVFKQYNQPFSSDMSRVHVRACLHRPASAENLGSKLPFLEDFFEITSLAKI